ncbi:polyadenylate-binding protein-interacting protein 2-like [Nelusetta ayraudi]|uniref:polyadenylate-binding protein-interacting protein 2-like n=1 Tax=Nelusetta ayraudi TaxID=303726 RepID=UPI003F6E9E1E
MKDPRLSTAPPPSSPPSGPELHLHALSSQDEPFAEYLWMEHEEEFNRQVEEELWEEDFIERCVQELLEEEEQWEWFIPSRDLLPQRQEQVGLLVRHQDIHQDADFDIVVINSRLNPNAKEFIPGIQQHTM